MKKVQLVVLMMLFAVAAFAQSQPKVIAVVNTASWCPACQANGERVEKDIVASYAGSDDVAFVVNDLSDKSTKKQSKENLEKEGVYNAVKDIKVTGLIILLNAETHEVIQQISVKETNETLKQAIDNAING